jgi:hypothetical protein
VLGAEDSGLVGRIVISSRTQGRSLKTVDVFAVIRESVGRVLRVAISGCIRESAEDIRVLEF